MPSWLGELSLRQSDDFPTPPWATRGLIEHPTKALSKNELFGNRRAQQRDFLTYPYETNAVDWVITNLPFRSAEEFVVRLLRVARHGVALLARTVILESVGRYGAIFVTMRRLSSLNLPSACRWQLLLLATRG